MRGCSDDLETLETMKNTKVRSQSISTYVNAPIRFNIFFSVMIVTVMMPLWQMKLSLQALRREMSVAAAKGRRCVEDVVMRAQRRQSSKWSI